jgi:hypothetical protein
MHIFFYLLLGFFVVKRKPYICLHIQIIFSNITPIKLEKSNGTVNEKYIIAVYRRKCLLKISINNFKQKQWWNKKNLLAIPSAILRGIKTWQSSHLPLIFFLSIQIITALSLSLSLKNPDSPPHKFSHHNPSLSMQHLYKSLNFPLLILCLIKLHSTK